jgi:hypothetical protein
MCALLGGSSPAESRRTCPDARGLREIPTLLALVLLLTAGRFVVAPGRWLFTLPLALIPIIREQTAPHVISMQLLSDGS